jgi:UDP-N-acetylmuramoyl-tripeptide--D-alanyl-D-alanine ligase
MLFQKKLKNLVRQKIEGYTRSYFAAHPDIKLVVVTGSVGKTSTKIAIATMLGEKFRVRFHEGNHNTEMSAPLAMMGIQYPDDIKSISAWRKVFHAAEARILQPSDVNVIVQELGADHPGEIADYHRYLHPDIAVVTAVTPEHMEFFQTMGAVAQEELAAANFSKLAIINRDDVDGSYAGFLTNPNIDTYGTSPAAEYRFEDEAFSFALGHEGKFIAPEFPQPVPTKIKVVGEHNLRPAIAAAVVGVKLGMNPQEIARGLTRITPVPGRMRPLDGLQNSTIIDDTYNSSPAAAESAINTLLSLDAPQKIAILGSMSELGEMSAEEHTKLGKMFNPDNIDWVITVGEDAGKYLASAAHANGAQVKSFSNAVEAGGFAHSMLRPNALILVKGSQNGIFTEEAIKVLLRRPEDMQLLVRQSPAWMAHKEEFFAQFERLS